MQQGIRTRALIGTVGVRQTNGVEPFLLAIGAVVRGSRRPLDVRHLAIRMGNGHTVEGVPDKLGGLVVVVGHQLVEGSHRFDPLAVGQQQATGVEAFLHPQDLIQLVQCGRCHLGISPRDTAIERDAGKVETFHAQIAVPQHPALDQRALKVGHSAVEGRYTGRLEEVGLPCGRQGESLAFGVGPRVDGRTDYVLQFGRSLLLGGVRLPHHVRQLTRGDGAATAGLLVGQ